MSGLHVGDSGVRGRLREKATDHDEIALPIASKTTVRLVIQVGGGDGYQLEVMSGNLFFAPEVVKSSLLTPVDSGDREAVGLVEVRNRFVVLPFPVLDDQPLAGPVSVDREGPTTTVLARVAAQPFKAMLP